MPRVNSRSVAMRILVFAYHVQQLTPFVCALPSIVFVPQEFDSVQNDLTVCRAVWRYLKFTGIAISLCQSSLRSRPKPPWPWCPSCASSTAMTGSLSLTILRQLSTTRYFPLPIQNHATLQALLHTCMPVS